MSVEMIALMEVVTRAGKTSAKRVIRENRKQYPRVYIEKSEGFEGIQRRWR